MKKVILTILLATSIFILTGCKIVQKNEEPELTDNNVLLTIYTDTSSNDYQSLGNEYNKLNDNTGDLIKFVSNKDGVKVKLEYIDWDMNLKYHRGLEEEFNITTKSEEVYAFNANMQENTPNFRLVVEYENTKNIWYVVYNVKDKSSTIKIKGSSNWVAQDVDDTSNMIPFCISLAISGRLYGNDYLNYTSEEVWETIANILTMTYIDDQEDNIFIEEVELEKFIKVIFPNINGVPQLPKDKLFVHKEDEVYSIRKNNYGDLISYELVGCYKDEETDKWVVTVSVRNNDEDDEIGYTKVIYLKQNEKHDEMNPFDYHIINLDELWGV